LAGADNFAVEQGKVDKAIEWMNSYAKKNNKNLQVKREGYLLPTIRFGNFELYLGKVIGLLLVVSC